jgi:hypothetical protein
MNREKSELILIGGGFLLAPVAACAVAIPWFLMTREPLWPIIVGTVVGMGFYIGGCWLHSRSHPGLPGTDMAESAEKQKDVVETSKKKQ